MEGVRIHMPKSIKAKYAISFSILIIIFLLLSTSLQLALQKNTFRKDIEVNSLSYALLARKPICEAYELYYNSGYYKFRELMLDLMKMNLDLVYVAILDVNGWQLFDSMELAEGIESFRQKTRKAVQDPDLLKRVRSLDPSNRLVTGPDGKEMLEIIAPHVEEWGNHKYSVLYRFSFVSLRKRILSLLLQATIYSMTTLLAAVLLAYYLSSKITKPLLELTDMSRDIARGNYGRTISIQTRDEVQDLANSFNMMSLQLRKSIGEIQESHEQLVRANEELKELDHLKSDILSNVSHELRTPLTTIRGYAESMADSLLGPVSPDQEKGLRVMERSLNRLSLTIGQLLEFSRLSSGKISLDIRPFDILLLIRLIVNNLREEFEMREIDVAINMPESLPSVEADQEKIAQILENLIANSIKFTPPGGTVELIAHRTEHGVKVTVRDNGVGIPEKEIPYIFDRFHQVDGSSTRRFGGLGLGLAIVKQLLDAHGARIDVFSKEGEGSEFSFTLPALAFQDSALRSRRIPIL